jgi:hypothetical protein
MRAILPLSALLALALVGCSNAADSVTGPSNPKPSLSCAGQSSNCGGGNQGGGNHNNNPNNPPATAP